MHRLQSDKRFGAVAGPCLIPEGQSNLAQLVYDVAERARDFNISGKECPYINCANTLIKKSAFERSGLFNPDWISHQDFDMTYRFHRNGCVNFFRTECVFDTS